MELMTEEKKGFKKTEVGLIPEGWELSILGDDVELVSGHHVMAKFCNTEGNGMPYLTGPADFPNGTIKQNKFTTKPSSICRKNDILVTVKGSGAGTIVLSDDTYCISRQLMAVRPRSWDNKYLYYVLKSKQEVLEQAATGLIPGLSRGDILDRALPKPTLTEQQAIATALSEVDELIRTLDRLIEKKEAIKTGTMQQLLTGKKRLPGFDGEWVVKKLGEFADIQRGASPRPISDPKWFSEKKEVGWVRISDIKGKYLYKTRDYLSNEGMKRSRFLEEGSLIMSIAATVGLPVITRMDLCIHDGFVGFWNLRNVDQEYLFYKLKFYRSELEEEGQTGSQSNINSEIVRNFEKRFPSVEEQKAIAKVLSDMDQELQTFRQKREKYVQIKQGMMQELLTGKTRLV